MFLKIDQQLERCRRVIRQRVRPRIHPVLRHLDVEMFDIPGEPMPTDEFFAGLRRGEIPFEPFTMGSQWDTTWGTTWFKLSGQVPEGKPDGRPLELWIDLGWYDHSCGGHIEGLVYRADGTAIKAVHPLNHWVPLIAADGAAQVELDVEGRFTVYLEAASNPLLLGVPPFIETELGDHATGRPDEPYTFRAADLTEYDERFEHYWTDLDVVDTVMAEIDKDSPRYWQLAKALQRSLNLFDEQDPDSVEQARAALAGVLSRRANASAMDISAIGHAHIDSAWLWPVRETRRKVARTVANALALMDDDPEFKYTMSSAQQYAWLEQDHPDIFARMKERIAVGRGSVALPKAEAIAEAIARTRTESRTLAGECLTLLDGAEQWNGIGACLRDDQSDPIIVTGPFADDMACFLGDYTAPLERTQITSVYRQLRERFGERVLLSADGTGLEGADWLNAAAVVAVLGGTSERSYDSAFADNGAAAAVAEHGATCGEGVDLCDVTLPWGQDTLLDRVRELTEAPVVSVVVSGRAHVLTHVLEVSDATLWAGLVSRAWHNWRPASM